MTQRCQARFFLVLCGLLTALMPLTRAETPQVLIEAFPVYNYTEKGQLTGFSTEVVHAVLHDANIAGEFQSQPWARAYETAQNTSNVLIYSITRTVQREHLFKWVSMIASAEFYLCFLPQRQPLVGLKSNGRYDALKKKWL
jgi:polar amino acid transport system substrate-binding protein